MQRHDYHTHSCFSDGENTQQEIINTAKSKGLKEIGISDHLCLHFPRWSMTEITTQIAIQQLKELKNQETEIEIKIGLEVDYIPGKEKQLSEILSTLALDYVIGAVHYLEEWNFDTTDSPTNTVIATHYTMYYDLISQAARSGLFDIIAHFDLIKKFNKLSPDLPKTAPLQALDAIAQAGIAMELNTNGQNHPCQSFYPEEQWLQEAYKRKIPILISSDAHKTLQLGQYFNQAKKILLKTGYTETIGFSKRESYKVTLC